MADQIQAIFKPMEETIRSYEERLKAILADDINISTMKAAKRLRLDMVAVRGLAKKAHDSEKKVYLEAGRAIDGVYNIFIASTSGTEKKLMDIEKHYELLEEEERQKNQVEREGLLEEYDVEIIGLDLGGMNTASWDIYLLGVQTQHAAKIEADRIAEESRILAEAKQNRFTARKEKLLPLSDFAKTHTLTIDTTEDEFTTLFQDATAKKTAHKEQQEKTRLENVRLQAEKVETERLAKIKEKKDQDEKDRIKAESDKALREEQEKAAEELRIQHEKQVKIEQDRIEKEFKEKEKADKIRKEEREAREKLENERSVQTQNAKARQELLLKTEQEAKEKLEREAKDAESERVRIEKERIEAEETRLAAPDKEKLGILLNELHLTRESLTTERGKHALTECIELLDMVVHNL
jgi:hypothetical protein